MVLPVLVVQTTIQSTLYMPILDFGGHSMVSTPLLKLSLCKDNVELKYIVETWRFHVQICNLSLDLRWIFWVCSMQICMRLLCVLWIRRFVCVVHTGTAVRKSNRKMDIGRDWVPPTGHNAKMWETMAECQKNFQPSFDVPKVQPLEVEFDGGCQSVDCRTPISKP